MKSALRPIPVLFFLFEICVFGDAVKVEIVSVNEGDSVTLHTDVTEIQIDDVIDWKLNGYRIARISGDPSRADGVFRDGLQLDKQTGDITITNITTTDSGEYKLKTTNSTGSSDKTFSVSVSADAVRPVSVLVGDSVTLHTDLTQTQRDDVVQWTLNSTIAKINRAAGIFSTYDVPDGRFKDRLQLDCLTGSLTIKNIGNTDSGEYKVDISISSVYTIRKSLNVTVRARGEIKPALSVRKGDSVTLHTGLTEIHTDDLMQWMFGDSPIAEINKADDDRLKLDPQTGSLTITDTRTEDSGVYELKISSSRCTVQKRFTVTVDPGPSGGKIAGIVVGCFLLAYVACAVAAVIYYRRKISEQKEWSDKGKILSVKEGESITLNPDDSDVHKNNKLVWIFRSNCLAVKTITDQSVHVPDERFKDRLKLNPQTGSLTITHTTTADTGVYELLIFRSGKSSIKRFCVSVFAETSDIEKVSVKEGESVTLKTGVTAIQKDDEILWTCGLYTPLAKITRETKKISPSADGIFKGRLELDDQTGSLTINKIKPTDAGIYILRKIHEEGNTKHKFFRVFVSDPTVNRNNPENVPLNSVETSPDSRL